MKTVQANSLMMKQVNTNLVRNVLKTSELVTKAELAKATGLTVVTVASILRELVAEGEAVMGKMIPSNGGRPSQCYSYNAEYQHVLVFYTHEVNGKDTLFIRVVNLLGKCVHNEICGAELLDVNMLDDFIDCLIVVYPTIAAIGFGLPGPEQNGTFLCDYPQLHGKELGKYYRERYHLPVVFDNDVNSAILGYCTQHGKMENIVVYIYFPDKYPPGVGVCINGKVYKGMNSFVGEVKYIPLGIDWKKLSADTQQNTCKAAAKLITTMICTINPQQIVLQGEFLLQGELSPEMALELVRTETARYLPETAMAELSVSTDFHKDFEQGIIRCTLELLSSKLCLVKE